jgi:hypothetical protein
LRALEKESLDVHHFVYPGGNALFANAELSCFSFPFVLRDGSEGTVSLLKSRTMKWSDISPDIVNIFASVYKKALSPVWSELGEPRLIYQRMRNMNGALRTMGKLG